MNIIEKDSKFLVEKDGKFCDFNGLKGAEGMILMLRMMENNLMPELSLVDIDEHHFDVKYDLNYLSRLKQWVDKHGENTSEFYEDDDNTVKFLLNKRTVSLSPYATTFMVSHKEDYEFERGREIVFKTPKTEKELLSVLAQI